MKFALALALVMTTAGTVGGQERTLGCRIDGSSLNCAANGDTDADKAEAMASTVTFAVLRKQLESPDFSKTAAGRELFRRSVERNRAAVERHFDRQKSALRRGSATKQEFAEARKAYDAAMKNYRAGILVHNSGIWNDPEGAEAD
jgi:hypothetical protein